MFLLGIGFTGYRLLVPSGDAAADNDDVAYKFMAP